MELSQLEVFLSVARERRFSRAAEHDRAAGDDAGRRGNRGGAGGGLRADAVDGQPAV